MSIEWYAVHTYVGQEDRVQQHLMERATKLGMRGTKIFQVLQPKEKAVELREGGKKEEKQGAAEKVASKFGARPAPLKVVGGRG